MFFQWLELELVNSPQYLLFGVFWEKKDGEGSRNSEARPSCNTMILYKNWADVHGLSASIFPYTEKGNELSAKN